MANISFPIVLETQKSNTQVLRELVQVPFLACICHLLKVTSHDGESEPASSLVSLHRMELILLAQGLTLVTTFPTYIVPFSKYSYIVGLGFNIWILKGYNSVHSRSEDAKHKLMGLSPFSHCLLPLSIHLLSIKPFQLHRLGKTVNGQKIIFKVTENKSEWIKNTSFPQLLLESPYIRMYPVQWYLSACPLHWW